MVVCVVILSKCAYDRRSADALLRTEQQKGISSQHLGNQCQLTRLTCIPDNYRHVPTWVKARRTEWASKELVQWTKWEQTACFRGNVGPLCRKLAQRIGVLCPGWVPASLAFPLRWQTPWGQGPPCTLISWRLHYTQSILAEWNGIASRICLYFPPLGLLTELMLLNSSEIILSSGSSQEGINDFSPCGELMIS